MGCNRTDACNYEHCMTCSEYEVSNLITTDNKCQYCETDDNDFVILNETTDYSGIEMALDRQGMLRVRYYDDSSHIWFSEDIVNIKFCPMCGRKMR